jgi:SnoaL-like domain
MRSANKLAEDYIAAWNETDAKRRSDLLAATFAPDATYVDPLMRGTSRSEIDGLIAAVQGRFPEFRFALAGPADGFGDYVRFSWALGPIGAAPVAKGTDFIVRRGDAIGAVTGFLDLVPAAT